ncbi:MAG: hypothetical protein QG671_3600 [Actinomycetota bacterium]|nr:hypothetical protein [Actinomycetota bacterium]
MSFLLKHHRGCASLFLGSLLFLSGVQGSSFAFADSTDPSTTSDILVFQDTHMSVEVSGAIATAINECVNDAVDSVIQTQQNACEQVAIASNTVEVGSIVVASSTDVSIVVTGGVATAIDQCVNDAVDSVIQTQQNACEQVAVAGNTVTVDEISVSSSRNVSIDINGGYATAMDQCLNTATGGTPEEQFNTCDQTVSAGNTVSVGTITIFASMNVMITIQGGLATAIYECLSDAADGLVQTQLDACTQVASVGNSTTTSSIYVYSSQNVTITIDGAVATAINQCASDAADGTVQNHQAACDIAAAAKSSTQLPAHLHNLGNRQGRANGQMTALARAHQPRPNGMPQSQSQSQSKAETKGTAAHGKKNGHNKANHR